MELFSLSVGCSLSVSSLQVTEAKDELKLVVDFLRSPEKYTRLGAQIPKGLLHLLDAKFSVFLKKF